MGVFNDDRHPNRVASALHKVLDFFLVLIGIGIIVIATCYIVILKNLAGLAVAMLLVGIGTVVFSVVGMFGSGFIVFVFIIEFYFKLL
jgi:hypothetical protein